MTGILAVILLALAWFFHGWGLARSSWLDWQSLMLLGLVSLALYLLSVGAAMPWRRGGQ